MKLINGQPAPDFATETIFGQPISLPQFAGKALLLSFFRNSACAMCNLQVHKLINHYPDYHARGLEIVAVFESPRVSVLENVSKQNVPFPIIADPEATLYDLYGLESSEAKVMAPVDMAWRGQMVAEAAAIGYPLRPEAGSNFFRLPADFLIGPDQRIHSAFYADVVGTHLSFEQIDAFLAESF